MRILLTITPRLYREVLALSISRRRPDFDVLLAPPRQLDGSTKRFRPHVLVQDADEAEPEPASANGVVCRVRMLITDRVDASIELAGTASVSKIHDVRFEDLFGALEKAEGLARGKADNHFPTVFLRSHLRGHR